MSAAVKVRPAHYQGGVILDGQYARASWHDLARAVLMAALTPRIVDGPEMDKP